MVVVAVEMPAERRAEVDAASFCLAGVVSTAARVPSVRTVFEVSVRRNASITRMITKKKMRKTSGQHRVVMETGFVTAKKQQKKH